jgi:hypothetical protein
MKRKQDFVKDWPGSIAAVKRERALLLSHCEACRLISATTATERSCGDMAEVGVASGAPARLIATDAPDRPPHLFDAFEGLPEGLDQNSSWFAKGQLRCSRRRTAKTAN